MHDLDYYNRNNDEYVEKMTPIQFTDDDFFYPNYTPSRISVLQQSNGNIVVIYYDNYTSSGGFFKIYDKDFNLIKDTTTFLITPSYDLAAAVLKNDSFVIACMNYDNQYAGSLMIFDKNGNNIYSNENVTGGNVAYVSVLSLKNGNFVFIYSDSGDSSYYGKFIIFDASGNVVKNITTFEENSTSKETGTSLENGNFIIAYARYINGNNQGVFQIFDTNGNIVKSNTVFHDNSYLPIFSSRIVVKETSNNNIFIADNVSMFLYNNYGEKIKEESYNNGGYLSVSILESNNIAVLYQDSLNYFGIYCIYNKKLELLQGSTVFNAPDTKFSISSIPLDKDRFLIAYSGFEAVSYGKLSVHGSNFLEIQKVDNNTARIWNNTQESLELILSITN